MATLSKQLRRIAFGLVAVLVFEYLVLPQIAGARTSLHAIGGIRFPFVGLGVALEVASIVAYAQLTNSILKTALSVRSDPEEQRSPSIWTIVRIELATLGISHVLPGGSAAGGGLGYRLLTAEGVDGTGAGFTLATQSVGSAVVLNILLWIALVVSIPFHGVNPLYLTAAIVGLALIGFFSLAVIALTRGEQHAARLMQRIARRIPVIDEDKLLEILRVIAERLRVLASDRRLLTRIAGWAAANWLFDAASLWVFLFAFGYRAGIDSLLVSYGLANVLAAIPITPGGLGVVEAVLSATLVGFGAPHGEAVLGVIGWRLVNFWLPIPFGAAAYLSLRFESKGRSAAELRRITEVAAKEAEDLRTWSDKHAVRLPRRGER